MLQHLVKINGFNLVTTKIDAWLAKLTFILAIKKKKQVIFKPWCYMGYFLSTLVYSPK